jgi:beta-phosphoglucomutase-like phosphatase (HAD superfamily)
VQALLWDNDGVLVDTEPLYFRATREILAGAGIRLDEALYIEMSLRRGESLFRLVEEKGCDPAAVAELRDARNARYAELLTNEVRVLDGVVECLEALHGRVPMAIVTSSLRGAFESIHQQTGLLDYFEFALTSGDYELHKPHPEPYLRAAEALEDTERGLESATRAGMRCLVIPNSLTRGFRFETAHAVLESARDVPAQVEPLLA